jgi:hypothetical protein
MICLDDVGRGPNSQKRLMIVPLMRDGELSDDWLLGKLTMRKHSDEMDSGVRMSNRCLRKTLGEEKSLEEAGKVEDIGEWSLERLPTMQ